jgi:hypothetical protein
MVVQRTEYGNYPTPELHDLTTTPTYLRINRNPLDKLRYPWTHTQVMACLLELCFLSGLQSAAEERHKLGGCC